MKRLLARFEAFQERNAWAGFPFAVVKKFADDRAGQQAALIAYFGFFSLFPLLLVATTVLGMVLHGDEELRERIIDTALGQFPIIGREIQENIGAFAQTGVPLLIGIVGAVWAGLGVIRTLGAAMDRIWHVPVRLQRKGVAVSLRALGMLGVLGAFVLVAAVLSNLGAGTYPLGLGRVIPLAGSLILNVTVFLLAFKLLTAAEVRFGDVLPGALIAGAGWTLLHAVGNYLVTRQLTQAGELYGFFGIVIGLLSWMYIGAQLTLAAAEVNVVRKLRLWPRSLSGIRTDIDRRALSMYARAEERVQGQTVEVSFPGAPDSGKEPGATVEVSHNPSPKGPSDA